MVSYHSLCAQFSDTFGQKYLILTIFRILWCLPTTVALSKLIKALKWGVRPVCFQCYDALVWLILK